MESFGGEINYDNISRVVRHVDGQWGPREGFYRLVALFGVTAGAEGAGGSSENARTEAR